MFCNKCGKELDDKAVVCVGCGSKVKKKSKNVLKKWWFWLIVVIAVIAIAAGGGEEAPAESGAETPEQEVAIVYEQKDLKTMFADLGANALKAEELYQGKYIEVTGEISNFDSDGSYVSIRAVGADAWDFNTMMCYIKNDAQKQFLLNKSVGDSVTIKGKIKDIGEVLGYSLNIDEVK